MSEAPTPTPKPRKVRVAKKTEPAKPIPEPTWKDLYWILAITGEHLLKGLTKRSDIPEDAQEIIHAVISLIDTRECFFAESDDLTPARALFWADKITKSLTVDYKGHGRDTENEGTEKHSGAVPDSS